MILVTKRSKKYGLRGILPVGGIFSETYRAFCWHRQMSSNAISTSELFQAVVEKIEFIPKNSNPSKPEVSVAR